MTGKEEYADIISEEESDGDCCCGRGVDANTQAKRDVGGLNNASRVVSPLGRGFIFPDVTRTAAVAAAAAGDSGGGSERVLSPDLNNYVNENTSSLSHGFGIYIWGFYQVHA